jgi:hypothetical protein
MRFENYVFFMFSLAFVGYLMGFTSPVLYMAQHQQMPLESTGNDGSSYNPSDVQPIDYSVAFFKALVDAMTNPAFLLSLGVGAVASVFLQGFSVMFLIPLLLLTIFMNLVVFPISFIFDPTLPDIIKLPITLFYNILLFMAILSFVRGGN